MYEKRKGNTFENIHTIFPKLIAKLCKKYNLENFIHISALGINEATDSKYAISKLEGEKNILDNFEEPGIDESIKEELSEYVSKRIAEGGAPTDF